VDTAKRDILVETVAVLLAALCLTALVLRAGPGMVFRYRDIIIAALWLYLPLLVILVRKVSLSEIALEKLRPGKSLLWFGIAALAVLPVFYLAAFIGAVKLLDYGFRLKMPGFFRGLCLGQLLVVSLPKSGSSGDICRADSINSLPGNGLCSPPKSALPSSSPRRFSRSPISRSSLPRKDCSSSSLHSSSAGSEKKPTRSSHPSSSTSSPTFPSSSSRPAF